MKLFDDIAGFLKEPVGNNLTNNPDDVRGVKDRLRRIGYFDDEEENGFITKDLDDAIKTFQRDNDLKVDGYLLPRGETENTITEQLGKRVRTPGIVPEQPKQAKPDSPFVLSLQDDEPDPVQFDATGRIIRNWDRPSEKKGEAPATPPTPQKNLEKKSLECSQKEIASINAQGAYQVAKDNLRRVEIEFGKLNQHLLDLNTLLKKETNNVTGDRGKARDVGAVVGTVIGGILGKVPGAAAGMGAGSNLGPIIEEGVDFITGNKTDLEIRLEIKRVKEKSKALENKIQGELKPKVEEMRKLAKQARQAYFDCKKKSE